MRRTVWLFIRDTARNFHVGWLTGAAGIFLFYGLAIITSFFGKPGEKFTGILAFVKWLCSGGTLAVLIVGLGYSMLKTIHAMREELDGFRRQLDAAPVLGLLFDPSDPTCKSSDRSNDNFWETGMLRVGVKNTGNGRAEHVRMVIARTDPAPPYGEVIDGYQLPAHPHGEREFAVQHDSGGAPSVYVRIGFYEVWRHSGGLTLGIENGVILVGKPEIKLLLRLEHERGSILRTLVLSPVGETLAVTLREDGLR